VTDSTETTPIQEIPAEVPAVPVDPVVAVAKKLTIKELLAQLGKDGGTKILKERPIILYLPSGEEVDMVVKELTKNQYDYLISRTTRDMPQVPMLDQHYTTARRDPLTGVVKPAGVYQEPNPNDQGYVAATQAWFNDSAIEFGLFCAAKEFGIDLSLPEPERGEQLDAIIENLNKTFPTPTLLDIAVQAALINRGIPLAEQLLAAVQSQQAMELLGSIEQARERLDEEFKVESASN